MVLSTMRRPRIRLSAADPAKRTLCAVLAATTLVLVAAATAPAATLEITNSGVVEPPSCPSSPCAVVSRTTAVQVKDGAHPGPFVIKHDGTIAAWAVTLAMPSVNEIHYFDGREGGTARAALAILRSAGGLGYELVALSPIVHVQPFFGKTAHIRLATPIPVAAGDIVALTVPTWLPALALDYPRTTSWRASRSRTECADVAIQTAQAVVGASAIYGCLYQTAVITYSATETTSG
jgi:hypothetical protein